MKVAIVYEDDPALGPDPLDEAAMPRRLGEFLDSGKVDVFVAWREIGEQFKDGARIHFVGSGIWENLSMNQYEQLQAWLLHDGLDAES